MADEQITELTVLSIEDKEFLKSKTPYVLPDNPSDKKWSASQIKAKMYEGFFVLYEWLKRSAIETNQIFHALISGDITIDALIERALKDASGNVITETYETKSQVQTLISGLQTEITSLIDTRIVGYVELTYSTGTLTNEQYNEIQNKCCVIAYDGDLYYKSTPSGSRFQLASLYQQDDKTYIKYGVLQIDDQHHYTIGETNTSSYYTAAQIDTLLDGKVPKAWVDVVDEDINDLFEN